MFDDGKVPWSLGALMACCLLTSFGANADDLLVDPTRPIDWNAMPGSNDTETDEQMPTFVLHGVFTMAGVRSAVINGSRLGVGDWLDDAQLVAIERDRVRLRANGTMVELQTPVAPVKHPASTDREMAARLPLQGEEGPR